VDNLTKTQIDVQIPVTGGHRGHETGSSTSLEADWSTHNKISLACLQLICSPHMTEVQEVRSPRS